MKVEFTGCIGAIRAVEDTIRAAKQYTESLGTMRKHHPVQGEEFSSKVFCKYYEVYPGVSIDWNMPVNKAYDWLFKDTPCLDVVFWYDYRSNKASVTMKDGSEAVEKLATTTPGFRDALMKITAAKVGADAEATNQIGSKAQPAMGDTDRLRTGAGSNPQPMVDRAGH